MVRCAAVRDALHRIRQEPRGAHDILRELGGLDLAVATGLLLGAAARRIPVLVDGPLGIAAGLVARDLAGQTRHWCLLPEAGTLALVHQGADVLGLTPVLELGLDLGEGANALAALPLLRTVLGLAAALPVHPALLSEPGDAGLSDDDFAEDGIADDGLTDDDATNDNPADDNPRNDDLAGDDHTDDDLAGDDLAGDDLAGDTEVRADGARTPDGFGNPAAGFGADVEGGAAGRS
jgi:hypothetical protein